jgi:FdhD protein
MDELACEALVKLQYNEDIIANLLATPKDIHELFIGHLVSEGYVKNYFTSKELSFNVSENQGSYDALLSNEQHISRIGDSNRVVTSSCGACNSDGLEQLISDLPLIVKDESNIDLEALNKCFKEMKTHQLGFQLTGGVHAAGLIDSDNNLLFVLEDIGRHNAVDKVVGRALINDTSLSNSTLLLSGRCGWDIVAKASRCGITNIASIGACSSLAAKAARYTGVRIISFLKNDNAVIIGDN